MRTRIMLFVILVVSISVQAQQPLVPHNANEALETAQECGHGAKRQSYR